MKRNLTVGISYEATYPATIPVSLLRHKVARERRPSNRCFMRKFWKFIIGSQNRRYCYVMQQEGRAFRNNSVVRLVVVTSTRDRLCPSNYLL